MKAYVKSNTMNPDIESMNDMVGGVFEIKNYDQSGADHCASYLLVAEDGDNWYFYVDDVVLETEDEFTELTGLPTVKVVPVLTEVWHKDHEFVTIARSDLQALQSLLKEEIKDLGNFSYAAKSDAKHFLSSGLKGTAKQYFKLYDKLSARQRSLEKRMTAVKKALT